MPRRHPVIWVIGATRSCKTVLATHGAGDLGFKLFSTSDYFRERYGKEDTFSRDFVFQLSAFSAEHLCGQPDSHAEHLERLIEEADQPCVIEGERNPIEFAKLYDPQKDMVILLHRVDVDTYDTTIERGIPVIEQNVRWCINTGIAPATSAFKVTFGDEAIKGQYFGANNSPDFTFIEGPVKKRRPDGDIGDQYPWIGILVGMVREKIKNHYGADIRPEVILPERNIQPVVANNAG